MENLFEENQVVGFDSNYPELQVVPAAAGAAVLYGVIGGVISGVLLKGCEGGE